MRSLLVVLCVLAIGCAKEPEPPKTIDITLNGTPITIPEFQPENDPEKAATKLAEEKAQWLDESGELKEGLRSGTFNRRAATSTFEQIATNHPDTPAGKEAKAIAERLAK